MSGTRPQRHHLVVLHKRYLNALLAGVKRIECRLSAVKRSPYGAVAPGDLLWLKLPSRPVHAVARAGACRYRELHRACDLEELARRHADLIRAEPAFFAGAARWARFASLIWIETILAIRPLAVSKSDKRAWVVLDGAPRPGMRIGAEPWRA
jgi:hypothetical protein